MQTSKHFFILIYFFIYYEIRANEDYVFYLQGNAFPFMRVTEVLRVVVNVAAT
jgi:hypothetical protein